MPLISFRKGEGNTLIITWKHREFKCVARERYLTAATMKTASDQLSGYFSSKFLENDVEQTIEEVDVSGELARNIYSFLNAY